MKKLRFGIVGCGVIAAVHGHAIRASERADLVAVCDILADRAEAFGAEFGAESWYSDYGTMLQSAQLDIVCICTPSGMHADMACSAAEAGVHVLSEKPLDICRESMSRMIDTCSENGVKLGGIYQRRLMPEAIATRQALQSGKFGKPILCDAYLKYYRSQAYYDSAGWRGTYALDGGGALMNQGVHGVDLLLWMVGDVRRVTAKALTLGRSVEVEDTAVAILEFDNGAVGVIEGATTVYPAQSSRFELHCSNGSIIFSDDGFQNWRFVGDETDSFPEIASEKLGGSADPGAISVWGHVLQIEDMIDAVLEDREPLVTGHSARKAVDLILAIYESSRTGRAVDL